MASGSMRPALWSLSVIATEDPDRHTGRLEIRQKWGVRVPVALVRWAMRRWSTTQ